MLSLTYDELVTICRKELYLVSKGSSESIDGYADRITNLATAVYWKCGEESIKRTAIDMFLKSVMEEEDYYTVVDNEFAKSLEEAIAIVQEYRLLRESEPTGTDRESEKDTTGEHEDEIVEEKVRMEDESIQTQNNIQSIESGYFSNPTRARVLGCLTILALLLIITFIAFDVRADTERLISFGGLCLLVFLIFITSKAPSKVRWTPVLWGLILQFTWGVVILRWKPGYEICKLVGDAVVGFLTFADEGSKFVFDAENYTMHVIVFKPQILPVVVYFSSVVSILYYLGVMQVIIKGLAKLFQYTMNTTAIESFAAAAHIFIGQLESSIALKPFFRDLTLSELHCVMTTGFATVAGTVIAAYIEFGVPAEHVISASFMSAPAAIAVAKLGWPETKVTRVKQKNIVLTEVGQEMNVMEAASVGAVTAIKLVSYVVANLIAFISILAFINYCFSFMGARVGHPEFTFEFFCSYTFMPLAFVMGVRWQDCGKVAKLIGKKLFINEFLSFADLGTMIKNKELDNRSAVIATYILCGFGSIVAMGINLGALTAADPSRRQDYAKGMLRAMISGNVACFMTACVAGMLYQESNVQSGTNVTTGNGTTMALNFSNIDNSSYLFT
ncbi:solute carrier family 28 member 3-like [Pecten maximus]|uniref:solute carrier family 28 member 3-like n=1 Tax=Pecten maximus TaxID=6579 RepID=UPI001459150C|nr:solute carrier family 28 member 3-like [Pecten maximus]